MENQDIIKADVKIPKKRGRKPTGKIFQIDKGNVKNVTTDDDCIIAYLPLSLADTKNIVDISETEKEDKSNETNTENTHKSSIINDLKNIISHTSECSSEKEVERTTFTNKKNDDGTIAKLKMKIEELERIIGNKNHEIVNFDKLHEICIDMTKGNIEHVNCWWCCFAFNHYPIGLPDNYKENVFHTYGYFCSFNCAKSYNLEKFDNKCEEKNCLLLILKTKFPPSKPLKLYVEDEYKNKITRFQNDYKVKRTKPLSRTSNNLNNLLKYTIKE